MFVHFAFGLLTHWFGKAIFAGARLLLGLLLIQMSYPMAHIKETAQSTKKSLQKKGFSGLKLSESSRELVLFDDI